MRSFLFFFITQQGGSNPQDLEAVYKLTNLPYNMHEHKGLLPGIPVSFLRYSFFDKAQKDNEDIKPLKTPLKLSVGMAPIEGQSWQKIEEFETDGYKVVITYDEKSAYFQAFPKTMNPKFFTGDVSSDLVRSQDVHLFDPVVAVGKNIEKGMNQFKWKVGSIKPLFGTAVNKQGAGMVFSNVSKGTIFSGQVKISDKTKEEITQHLAKAESFLKTYYDAMSALKKGDVMKYSKFLVKVVMQTHQSKIDPRTLTEGPYADWMNIENVKHWFANQWFGSDMDWLSAINEYYIATIEQGNPDQEALKAILVLSDWMHKEGLTQSGAFYMKKGFAMMLVPEYDKNTGRIDVFIDNSLISICFNHVRIIIRRGYERIPCVTWGAFETEIEYWNKEFNNFNKGKKEAVDEGQYHFSIDMNTVPETFKIFQDSFLVARDWKRLGGDVLIKDFVGVDRGIPVAKIYNEVHNTGTEPFKLKKMVMNIADYLHLSDSRNDMKENQYGMSPDYKQISLPIGFYMEGSPVFYGHEYDQFPKFQWKDFTDEYLKLKKQGKAPRYMVLYGFDRTVIYRIPEEFKEGDRIRLYNSDPARTNHKGWEKAQIEFQTNRVLKPGESAKSPEIESYVIWSSLASKNTNLYPDELEYLAPKWVQDVIGDVKSFLSIETDYAGAGATTALIKTAKTMKKIGNTEKYLQNRTDALKGVDFSLKHWKLLSENTNFMPSFGIMRYYGYLGYLADWAYEETGEQKYLDDLIELGDDILSLQITNPSLPNYGAFLINRPSEEAGANNLDDQGIKLWLLKIAYDRTGDIRYKQAVELFIKHWVQVHPLNYQFWGITKYFDLPPPEEQRVLPDGRKFDGKKLPKKGYRMVSEDHQVGPYGNAILAFGLAQWKGEIPRVSELLKAAMRYHTGRYRMHMLGIGGMRRHVYPYVDQPDTNVENQAAFLNFLMSLHKQETKQGVKVRTKPAPRPTPRVSSTPSSRAARKAAKGFSIVLSEVNKELAGSF